MSGLAALEPLELEGFRAETRAPATLALRGRLTPRTPVDDIGPYFKRVHDAAVGASTSELCIDLTELSFMSSSAIRTLVAWLGWLEAEPEPARYALVFRVARDADWLEKTLDVLSTMGAGRVRVEHA